MFQRMAFEKSFLVCLVVTLGAGVELFFGVSQNMTVKSRSLRSLVLAFCAREQFLYVMSPGVTVKRFLHTRLKVASLAHVRLLTPVCCHVLRESTVDG